ncbi:hypothetical protein B9Z55_015162 [Caenorhabditis nigoni]|uniref:Uncharacterized protein n=1 Tax=Caenorhabditis nigoni TaxID=1611254 RepID=A0A2G5U904_9PELO|nr:hypothetical protein B9Z55_015162 [Caenorhabditis nigoni]
MNESFPLMEANPPPDRLEERKFKLRTKANNACGKQWSFDLGLFMVCVLYYVMIIATLSCSKYPTACASRRNADPQSLLSDGSIGLDVSLDVGAEFHDGFAASNGTSSSSTKEEEEVTTLYVLFGVSVIVKFLLWLTNIFVGFSIVENSDDAARHALFLSKYFTIFRVIFAFFDTVLLVTGKLLYDAHKSIALGFFGLLIYPLVQFFYVLGCLAVQIDISMSLKEVLDENFVEELEMGEVQDDERFAI